MREWAPTRGKALLDEERARERGVDGGREGRCLLECGN